VVDLVLTGEGIERGAKRIFGDAAVFSFLHESSLMKRTTLEFPRIDLPCSERLPLPEIAMISDFNIFLAEDFDEGLLHL